jgi:hypothetical protein
VHNAPAVAALAAWLMVDNATKASDSIEAILSSPLPSSAGNGSASHDCEPQQRTGIEGGPRRGGGDEGPRVLSPGGVELALRSAIGGALEEQCLVPGREREGQTRWHERGV